MADLFEPTINPCRCGETPKITNSDSSLWSIQCGDSKHFYGLSRASRHEAIRDWNTSLASNKSRHSETAGEK